MGILGKSKWVVCSGSMRDGVCEDMKVSKVLARRPGHRLAKRPSKPTTFWSEEALWIITSSSTLLASRLAPQRGSVHNYPSSRLRWREAGICRKQKVVLQKTEYALREIEDQNVHWSNATNSSTRGLKRQLAFHAVNTSICKTTSSYAW
jgi:hypothetical protein